jgi:membrane dipeptidase
MIEEISSTMLDPAAFHRSLLTLDSHIDIPWPESKDPFTESERAVDFPKMRRGGLWAGCFAAYVPQTLRTPENREQAVARAEAMLQAIHSMGRTQDGIRVRVTARAADVEAAWREGVIAVIPVIENGHALGGDPGNLAHFRKLGVCYLTLTHNGHNDLADSAIPKRELGDGEAEHGGLSPLGRTVIAEMNRLGIIVDVSHAAKTTMMQAAELSRSPVIASHSGVRAICDHPRNLDDEQLDLLRDRDGLIQITAMPAFLRPQGKMETVGVADLVDHIDYAVRRIGIRHVGISSDFDGGGGIKGWSNAAETPNITAELLARGYGQNEIRALWGGNFLRVLRRAEELAG